MVAARLDGRFVEKVDALRGQQACFDGLDTPADVGLAVIRERGLNPDE